MIQFYFILFILRGRPNKTKKALVRQNENNSLSPRSSQTDSSTSKSDNSLLLVDRNLNANKLFRDQDIDDTANDADINLSCEVNIIANGNDINAQTTTFDLDSSLVCLFRKLYTIFTLKNHQIHRPLLNLKNRMI